MASFPKVSIFSPSEKEECLETVSIFRQQEVLAVDSEGIQLGKDGPLTLLQIGTKDGSAYLFDVMLDKEEQDKHFFEDTGLGDLLESSEIVKVLHSSGGDSAALFHQFGIKLENVFDTQVAHLVIEEHKGCKIPLRVKLEELFSMYLNASKEYTEKDVVQLEFLKKNAKFWATRPLTQNMIDYASNDVSSLLIDVYVHQKRYLEENELMATFSERLQEEIEFEIDEVNKERRQNRFSEIKRDIISTIYEQYEEGTVLDDLTSDEKRALKNTSLTDIKSANYPEIIRNLKLESLDHFLQDLEEKLRDAETFYLKPHVMHKLKDIESAGTKALKEHASRLKKIVQQITIDDIERKYDINTPLSHISRAEIKFLQNLRPLYDDIEYTETVNKLYWKVIEDNLDEDLERLASDPEFEVQNIQKLIRFIHDVRVPENVQRKAKEVRKINEDSVLERLPHKYDLDTCVDELTEQEKIVLDRLDVIRNMYDPVIVDLHWKVTYFVLCEDYENFISGKLKIQGYMSKKLEFLSTNERVPDITREKAKDFQHVICHQKTTRRGKKHNK